MDLFASPLEHCDSRTSGVCRPGQKRSAVYPHNAGHNGLYNHVAPCNVSPSDGSGDLQQRMQL